ncbi:MAG: isoprenylcysteine carboxylmethyltransferase family protein [Thermoanaerobaculia bacterium]
MRRPDYLAFGLAGYLAAFGSMVYFGFFLANLLVPRRVDSGNAPWTGSPGQALAVDLALLLAFALMHSVMARKAFKEHLLRIFPAALERSLYTLVAGLQIGLLCWAWQPLPASVWEVPAPSEAWAASAASVAWAVLWLALWALQGAGWAIVVAALATIGSTHLFGLQQASSAARGLPYVAPPFALRGPYRRVRHPVYTGTLIAFWSTPTMSQGRMLLVGVLTIYLFIGLVFEERDLERQFGEVYREHRRRVPSLFPRLLK